MPFLGIFMSLLKSSVAIRSHPIENGIKVCYQGCVFKGISMTYVVTEACIRCKYGDCIEVCPVDCFYEGANMLVINPEQCIDCGVCEPECPVDAIKSDNPEGMEKWVEFNQKYSSVWPNITRKKPAPLDADQWKSVKDKMHYFSDDPGEG